ncbi:hypothetical protein [Nonomuraea sediminis]|uniref:hypothetical protein n=1 Tax=Nonomuraea sediminis TaxID=2835864 RepID=UPI001BDBFF33|nr:hypothetical protein [Nonomuraea sediminis]
MIKNWTPCSRADRGARGTARGPEQVRQRLGPQIRRSIQARLLDPAARRTSVSGSSFAMFLYGEAAATGRPPHFG